MKKFLLASLALTLAVVSLTGCSSTSSSGTATSSIPAEDIAVSVGVAAKQALSIDSGITTVIGGLSASGLKASTADIAYTGGWWTGSDSYSVTYTSEGTTISSTMSWEYNFRLFDKSGAEIKTTAEAKAALEENLGEIWLYTTYTYTSGSTTSTYSYGTSKDAPLKFVGIGTSTASVSGTMKFTSSYLGTAYSLTFTYDALGLNASGLPTGSLSYSVTEGGATTASGSVVYNGTDVCQVSVTTGGVTYNFTYNMTTGVVTAVSI